MAAGAAFAGLTLTGAGTAGATTHAAQPRVYTNNSAGYLASGGGWRFRNITTTLKVPARQATAGNNADAAISLFGGATHTEAIVVRAGGGAHSVSYVTHSGVKAFSLSPHVGDKLKITISYSRSAHRDSFTVTNLSTGRTRTATVGTGGSVSYTAASFICGIQNSKVKNPAHDVRLWAFTNSHLTSLGGRHGAITGPWHTFRIVDTTNGKASGDTVMSPSSLSNHGQNFTMWLRHR